ncbi:MAG: hypothetical protein K0R15_2472 [Clostridiales bacterium]|jgi:hypothetical protein|nr:hypothetical protein [Clostridiales bacterium]
MNNINLIDKKAVNTETLMKVLDCGRKTATEIGNSASARICIGRRILWNVKLIQQYLDTIAE